MNDFLPVQELNAADNLDGHVDQLLCVQRLQQFSIVTMVAALSLWLPLCFALAKSVILSVIYLLSNQNYEAANLLLKYSTSHTYCLSKPVKQPICY